MEFLIGLALFGGLYGLATTSYAATVASLIAFGTVGFWVLLVAISIALSISSMTMREMQQRLRCCSLSHHYNSSESISSDTFVITRCRR